MTLYLSQLKSGGVVCRQGAVSQTVRGADSIYLLAMASMNKGVDLATTIAEHGLGETVDLLQLAADGKLDCPVRHPDPAHMFLTGTGLTHLGSASTRDAMHTKSEGMSDSMKMFHMGLEEGKPASGKKGVQPEWFYKGTGLAVVAPGESLSSPAFALDGGEEPEIAGFYINDGQGIPHRLGFTLANEFSDHIMERMNYLYLAHSKLRQAAFGPELLVGDLPLDIQGTSRILRAGEVVWEKPFLSGEANMSHTIDNLEYHHFKYSAFCSPGDLHVHMFGTATLSFADKVNTQPGDVFSIESAQFGLPLHNDLQLSPERAVEVVQL